MDVLVVAGDGGRTEGAQPHVEHVEEEGKGDEDLQRGEDLQGKRRVKVYLCFYGILPKPGGIACLNMCDGEYQV